NDSGAVAKILILAMSTSGRKSVDIGRNLGRCGSKILKFGIRIRLGMCYDSGAVVKILISAKSTSGRKSVDIGRSFRWSCRKILKFGIDDRLAASYDV